MTKRIAASSCAVILATWTLGAAAQEKPAGASDASTIQNAVKTTPASIAAGGKTFNAQCAACHGTTGKGDGKAGTNLDPKPADLTDAEWIHGSSDGEIFVVIRDGVKKTGMKSYASKLTPNDIWNLVNYLRSIGPTSAPTP